MVDKRTLYLVNRDGNASDPYESEDIDDWRPEASLTGKDCDSYASWKKRQLLRMDWDLNEVMALVTCWMPHGEYHCVLFVYLDGEVWVLDSTKPFIETVRVFEGMGYRFHLVPEYMQALVGQAETA